MSEPVNAIINSIPSDMWSGFYSGLLGFSGSIVGAVAAALITYQLVTTSAKLSEVNKAFLGLAAAIERWKVAVCRDHLTLANFMDADQGEYLQAGKDIDLAMMMLSYERSAALIQELTPRIREFQRELNRPLNERSGELTAMKQESLKSGAIFLKGPDWIKERQDLHASVENEINGRTEALQRFLKDARGRETSRMAKWWQFWRS